MALLFVRCCSRMTVFAREIRIRKCSKKFVEEETNNSLNTTDSNALWKKKNFHAKIVP